MLTKKMLFLMCITCIIGKTAFSQDTTSSDGLFQAARKAAFDNKDYPLAKHYCYKALSISPNYSDIMVFLGRIYTWTDHYDSAKICFETVLMKKADYEDASIAYADLEYWNNKYEHGLLVCNSGLEFHPQSTELLIRKAKIQIALRKFSEADETITKILSIDKSNTEAKALADRIKDVSAKNKLGISYEYTYFDKQFADPWHLVSVDYSRSTKIGSIAARINYANRFKDNGVQYEVDAYPRISKTFYSYVSAGYSDDDAIFPKYRAGFSLYANLPKSFEAEAGFRYLHFTDDTWIYTFYLGKYYKNWLFSARTYLTPSSNNISQSYNLGARYYYKGSAEDYVWLNLGTGISPDDRSIAQQLNSNYKLRSQKASLAWRFSVKKYNSFSLTAGWINQEYFKDTKGNQFEAGIGYTRRF
jgi:YaiO family outer membrane protein